MLKIQHLLIIVSAFLVSISPTQAADLNAPTGYISFAYSSDIYRVGYGSSQEDAIADAKRKCIEASDDFCVEGVATPPEWTHALMWCPEQKIVAAIAVSPDKAQERTSEAVLSELDWDYIKFNCVIVVGGDWEDEYQPVISWLINTH